jgi:hypothetical protein
MAIYSALSTRGPDDHGEDVSIVLAGTQQCVPDVAVRVRLGALAPSNFLRGSHLRVESEPCQQTAKHDAFIVASAAPTLGGASPPLAERLVGTGLGYSR